MMRKPICIFFFFALVEVVGAVASRPVQRNGGPVSTEADSSVASSTRIGPSHRRRRRRQLSVTRQVQLSMPVCPWEVTPMVSAYASACTQSVP